MASSIDVIEDERAATPVTSPDRSPAVGEGDGPVVWGDWLEGLEVLRGSAYRVRFAVRFDRPHNVAGQTVTSFIGQRVGPGVLSIADVVGRLVRLWI